MAITIHDSPDLYAPVNNQMRFVLSSTNSGQDNFRYVVDVYTSGVSGYVRHLFSPDPSTGQGYPDVSGTLKPQITFDLSSNVYGFQLCNNSYKAYEVKFGEQYGADASITTYANLAFSGVKYAWNGVFSSEQMRTFDYTLYTSGGGSAILSNQPDDLYWYGSLENRWFYFINDTSGTVYFAQIKTYNSSGTLLGTYKIENTYQASSSYLHKLLKIDVGEKGLNGATLYSGSQSVITAAVEYYTVELTNFAGTLTSGTYTYHRQCAWKGLAPITLHFLNRLGGFDSFNFRLARRNFSDVTRDTFEKNLGGVSSNTWTWNDRDRGTTIFNQEIKDRMILDSDWIETEEATWLQELIESPQVFYHTSETSIPVIVKQSSYEKKNSVVEKLFNLTIEVEYANKRGTQGA